MLLKNTVFVSASLFLLSGCASTYSANLSPSEMRSLSFSHGYCDGIGNELRKREGINHQAFAAISGQERAFSAGSFAARQDIRMNKYTSLSGIYSICDNLPRD